MTDFEDINPFGGPPCLNCEESPAVLVQFSKTQESIHFCSLECWQEYDGWGNTIHKCSFD